MSPSLDPSRDAHQGPRARSVTCARPVRWPAARPARRRHPIRTPLFLAALAAVVLTACPSAAQPQPQPETADDGIRFAGRVGTQQLNVSDGAPEVTFGDCDPNDGPDQDLCLVTHTVEGQPFVVVVENPGVLEEAARVPIRTPDALGCASGCDAVRDAAVVEVRRGDERVFATGGTLTVRDAGERYAADFVFELPGGSITGHFNVAP